MGFHSLEDFIMALGEALNMPLKVDARSSCVLRFNKDVAVQIQLDRTKKSVLIASKLGTLMEGFYRQEVFKTALHYNGLENSVGKLGFNAKSNQLILFQMYPLSSVDAQKFSKFIPKFAEQAEKWVAMIYNGATTL